MAALERPEPDCMDMEEQEARVAITKVMAK
jgi:hypothetical protein